MEGVIALITYGPNSDGVTGSEGGGGRLINVGFDIFTYSCSSVATAQQHVERLPRETLRKLTATRVASAMLSKRSMGLLKCDCYCALHWLHVK